MPRYAAALTGGLDRVAPEYPDLSLRLLTTRRGAAQCDVSRIGVDLVGGVFRGANAGPPRIVAEQLSSATADADLLHFFDLTGPLLAPRRRFVTTVHDAAIRHGFEGARVAHKRIIQPWALRHAASTVAVSAFARDEAVRRFGAEEAQIRVIHSGPGLIAGRLDGVAAPGPLPTEQFVLYVGNLAVHKNLPLLIRAFSETQDPARLVLVGRPGEGFEEIERAASRSPAAARIDIRRDASDATVDALYRGASMLALPSLYEGFGFTALEAMARGCPVLASDIPALREVSGEGALLLPPDDEAAWRGAIEHLLGDPGAREDLRERGRRTAGAYSWERTARGLCELLGEVGGRVA